MPRHKAESPMGWEARNRPTETMAEHFANLEEDAWPVRPGTDDEKYGPIARNN